MPKTILNRSFSHCLLSCLLLLGWQGLNAQISVVLQGTDPACFGLASGSIVSNVSGGTGSYTYQWSNGASTPFIETLTAGNYSLTVTDGNGTQGFATVTLNEPPQVTLNLTTDQQCQEPFTISANGGGGVPPYTYNWSTGASTQSVTVPSGSYCVTIVDANLCGTFDCIDIVLNPPSVSVTSVDVSCFGGENGTLTAFPSSGTPPYTYVWSNGATTQTATGLTAGFYGVTITDAGGCTASATGTVNQPSQLNVTMTEDGPLCAGEVDATITAFPSGGSPGYTYLWNTGSTTQAISGFGPGTYTVTVTDQNGCTVVGAATVLQAPSPDVTIIGDDVICGQGSSTELTAVPAGGTPNYQLMWSTGAVTPTIIVTAAGTYTVTVTDARGCTDVAAVDVSMVNLSVTTSQTNVSCNGFNNGSAAVFGSGGTQPYTYQWSNGATTQTITNLAPGTYSFTLTEADNCKVSGAVTITQPNPLQVSGSVDNPDCVGTNDGSINLFVNGGTPPYTYNWSNGATTEDLNNIGAGSYTVVVTDQNNCTTTATFSVFDPQPVIASTSVTDVACFGEATGAIDLSVTGGTPPYTYDWSDDGSEDPDDDPMDRVGLIAATYQVTVTDVNGCTAIVQATVGQPTALALSTQVTNPLCFGQNTGAVDLTVNGGTPPYTYSWSNGANTQDLSNVGAGTYQVVVTDNNNCTVNTTVTVAQPQQISVTGTANNVSCFEGNDGSINITANGGNPPYTYNWSNGANTEDVFNLVAGTYSVTVRDANNCVTSATFTVGQPSDLTLTTAVTNIACAGDATGIIDLTVTGGTSPYTYDWSNDGAEDPDNDTQDLADLPAGTYTVTVTDANGCTAVTSATIDPVNPIMLSATVSNLDCFEDNSGSIDLSVNGGSAPYTYQWSNGATTQDLNNVAAGTYTVTVTDVNECTASESYVVTQPDELLLSVSTPLIECGGSNTGTIIGVPVGGTEPYTYTWSNGGTTSTISELPAGVYGLTVTDANGCMVSNASIQVVEVPALVCNITINQEATTGNNGSLTANPDGGTAPYTYEWSNGGNSQTIDNLAAGDYEVTITDDNGCTTVCSATLQPYSGIGDYVWIDSDLDGIQDPNEMGFANVTVHLKDQLGNIIATTTTDENGFYLFSGLNPGTYSVQFVAPENWGYTVSNIGDDQSDSDIIPGMNGMTGTYDLDPGEFDLTVDAGLIFVKGVITNPCTCLNNATTDGNGQFREEFVITSFSGLSWTVTARENIYQDVAGNEPPAPLDLISLGTVLEEFPLGNGLSEYRLNVRLVDGLTYSITIQSGEQELSFSSTCTYPDILLNNAPPSELCVFDPAFPLSATSTIPGTLVYTINGQTVTAIDPSTLSPGFYNLEITLIPNDPDECEAKLLVEFEIADNCPAKVGDFVWNDTNFNGIQDEGEPGIPGVTVTITSQDGSFTETTTTDETGMYMFMVDPGTYKITFEQPSGLVVSPQNAGGDDTADSDVAPGMLMTDFFTLGPDEMNFTIDAGFYDECVANVTNPGTIGFDQTICGPGNVPDLIVELTPASGGVGEMNYIWMKNTVDPGQDISFWTPVPNSNSPNLQLGPVYESTYYARCVRRNNCVFIESNSIYIEVGDDANAVINGPNVVCELATATFAAVGAEGADNIQWSFSGPATVVDNGDGSVDVSWGSFGIFSATLSVTDNGCTATRSMGVTVTTNPATCGNGFNANGNINNLLAREVSINWMLPMDSSSQQFRVERSFNGIDFETVGTVNEPSEMVNGDMGLYHFEDVTPRSGRNYYRVELEDAYGNTAMSNVVELMLSTGVSQLAQVYPNPATGNMVHVQMMAQLEESQTTIELYSSTGVLIATQIVPENGVIVDLPLNNQPSGVYLLRIISGSEVETHQIMVD